MDYKVIIEGVPNSDKYLQHFALDNKILNMYLYLRREPRDRYCAKMLIELCNKDIELAPYLNKDRPFPAFHYLAEYYLIYAKNQEPIKAIQLCLKGASYKFEDIRYIYALIPKIIDYINKEYQIRINYNVDSNNLYDENTGEIINDIEQYIKEKSNETR